MSRQLNTERTTPRQTVHTAAEPLRRGKAPEVSTDLAVPKPVARSEVYTIRSPAHPPTCCISRINCGSIEAS